MLIGKEHSPTLTKISGFEFKYCTIVVVLISLLVNIGHGFQFQINDGKFRRMESTFSLYEIFPKVMISATGFPAYALAYFLINYVLFMIVNTGVEVALVKKLFKELHDKKLKLAEMTHHSPIQLKQKFEEIDQKERRAIKMVLLNGTINLVLRLPEFLVFAISSRAILGDNFLVSFSTTVYSTPTMEIDISYATYMLTFVTSIMMNYLFNDKFKAVFTLKLCKKSR
jgi:hypothetical protein